MKFKCRFQLFIVIIIIGMQGLFCQCSSTDCPLNNTVSLTAAFYDSHTGLQANMTDTLSIVAVGRRDTTLLNRGIDFNKVKLPMGYAQKTDTLLFRLVSKTGTTTDSIFVSHTNEPHFVSLDCSTAFFHTITGVRITRRTPTADITTVIDSIVVANPDVNYDEKENLKIYFSHY